MTPSPRYKQLSAANQANVLVHILTRNNCPVRRAIMRELPFASQYALACAVPRVVCAEHPDRSTRARELALTTELESPAASQCAAAYTDFLVDPTGPTESWQRPFWAYCMNLATRCQAEPFVTSLAEWAAHNDRNAFLRWSAWDWWEQCTRRRGPRALLMTFVEHFGYAMTRYSRDVHQPVAAFATDMVCNGCDWPTVQRVRAMLERMPRRPAEPPWVLDERHALVGLNPTVLRRIKNMIRLPLDADPWRYAARSDIWDAQSIDAMRWMITEYGYPLDTTLYGGNTLVTLLTTALRHNVRCYEWIEQHIVGRPDGDEPGRRDRVGMTLLQWAGFAGNEAHNWYLSALWDRYRVQFAAADVHNVEDVMFYSDYERNPDGLGRLAGTLCAYWPHFANRIERYACARHSGMGPVPLTEAAEDRMLHCIRDAHIAAGRMAAGAI